jgi:hypothetical protein
MVGATISGLITLLLSLRSCYLLIALFKLSLIEDIKRLVWLLKICSISK